jgi:hypothetical protein
MTPGPLRLEQLEPFQSGCEPGSARRAAAGLQGPIP